MIDIREEIKIEMRKGGKAVFEKLSQ